MCYNYIIESKTRKEERNEMTLTKMIEILQKYQSKGLGECNIFFDENNECDNIDNIEIVYNAEYETIDIKYGS